MAHQNLLKLKEYAIRKLRIRGLLLFCVETIRSPQCGWLLFKRYILGRPAILVCRRGGIGDIVATLPAIATLRQQAPYPLIIYETRQLNVALLKCCSVVDLVVEENTDLAVYCRRFLRPASSFRPQLPDERSPREPRGNRHIVDEFRKSFNLAILQKHSAYFCVSGKAQKEVRRRLRAVGIQNKPLVVIHTGPTWQVKEWPAENWQKLVARLVSELGVEVVQVGQDTCATGESRLSCRVEGAVNWVGKLTIEQTLALLKVTDLLVGIDSGMIHLAGAVSTPCVGLFGPTMPNSYLPQESPAAGVTANVPCLGCHHHAEGQKHWEKGCPNDICCMSELSVDEVFLACKKLLSRRLESLPFHTV
jgi:ADP-heptose:LPS heptosyltransferase